MDILTILIWLGVAALVAVVLPFVIRVIILISCLVITAVTVAYKGVKTFFPKSKKA